ncbi:MAG: FG-GAP-like repeat-containing protein, partial [Bacteroidota bacterium]
RNDGFEANWVTDTIFPEGNKPLGIAAGDIDDDEDPDVIMCSRDDDKVFGFKNDGLGNFTIFVVDPNVDGPVETEIADLDMDGDMDIAVVCEEGGQSVAIYLNDGSENFTRQILATNLKGTDLEIVNWNNDTIPDIFASFTESGIGIIGFISNGVGGYVADTFSIGNDDILSLKIADVDRDKNLDFVTGHDVSVNGLSHPIFISRTQSGSILENIPLADKIRGEIIGIDVGDIDNDGKLDVVYADFFGDNLVIVDIEDLGNQSTSIHPTALYRRLFRVYPNPSQGKLIIKKDAAANLKWSGYSFFDFSGMLLLDESWNSNREYLELDLKTYVSGYYVLQIKT